MITTTVTAATTTAAAARARLMRAAATTTTTAAKGKTMRVITRARAGAGCGAVVAGVVGRG